MYNDNTPFFRNLFICNTEDILANKEIYEKIMVDNSSLSYKKIPIINIDEKTLSITLRIVGKDRAIKLISDNNDNIIFLLPILSFINFERHYDNDIDIFGMVDIFDKFINSRYCENLNIDSRTFNINNKKDNLFYIVHDILSEYGKFTDNNFEDIVNLYNISSRHNKILRIYKTVSIKNKNMIDDNSVSNHITIEHMKNIESRILEEYKKLKKDKIALIDILFE